MPNKFLLRSQHQAVPPVVVGGDGEEEGEGGGAAEDDVAGDVQDVEPVGRRVGGEGTVRDRSLLHLPRSHNLRRRNILQDFISNCRREPPRLLSLIC